LVRREILFPYEKISSFSPPPSICWSGPCWYFFFLSFFLPHDVIHHSFQGHPLPFHSSRCRKLPPPPFFYADCFPFGISPSFFSPSPALTNIDTVSFPFFFFSSSPVQLAQSQAFKRHHKRHRFAFPSDKGGCLGFFSPFPLSFLSAIPPFLRGNQFNGSRRLLPLFPL